MTSSIFRFPLLLDENIRKNKPKPPRNPTYLTVCDYQWKLTGNPKYLKLAIKNGSTTAFHELGMHYENKKRTDLAMSYYEMGISYGCMSCMTKLAFIYYNKRDAQCVEYFQLAYNFGNTYAILMLADWFKGKPEEEMYLKLAIEHNNMVDAKIRLGILYEMQNKIVDAEQCYKDAYELTSDELAFGRLASLYENAEQYDKYVALHKQNIEKTNAVNSHYALGEFYNSDCEGYGNKELAMEYYKSAANLGEPSIPFIMHCLETNDVANLKRHHQSLEKYLTKEVNGKITNKIANAEHVEGNEEQAMKLHELAISLGNPESMYDLATICKKKGNNSKYIEYFELALRNNSTDAIKNVGDLYDFQYEMDKKQYEISGNLQRKRMEELVEE